jgi:hypothetical protein
VGLGADTVNGDTGGNPLLDVAGHGLCLCVAGAVEVVVVDVELGLWVGGLCGSESSGDKVLAENVVEDGRAEGAVFVEDLVDYVPGVDLAGVGGHELLDVSNHDLLELGLVGDGRDPGGELGVPDGSVATDELVVLGGEADERVGAVEGELALGSLGGIPLHAVLRSDLAEVVDDDLLVLALAESALIGGDTEVLLAVRLEGSVEGALGTVGTASGNVGSRAVGTTGSASGSRLSNGNWGDDGLGGVHRWHRRGRRDNRCRGDAGSSRRCLAVSTANALAVPVVALDARPSLGAGGIALEALATALSVGSSGENSGSRAQGNDTEVDGGSAEMHDCCFSIGSASKVFGWWIDGKRTEAGFYVGIQEKNVRKHASSGVQRREDRECVKNGDDRVSEEIV